MKHREDGVSGTRRSVAIVSIAAFLATPCIALAQTAKIETVATLPAEPYGRPENITEGPDGAIYVTALFDRIVWKIKDGKAERFFTAANYEAVSGVAGNKDELVISVFGHVPYTVSADGRELQPKPDAQDPACRSIVLDKSGKVKLTVVSPDAKPFFNGLARAGDHWYLIADSVGNQLLSLDTKAKTLEPWFHDPMINTNGIKVHNGWVYLTSTSRYAPTGDSVYRVRIGPDRKPMGVAVLFARGGPTNDFAIAPDGTLYIPSGKTMLKVTPSGQTSVFLSDIETENSPGAWVTSDGKWLYWPERFGPAKVKRVALK